MCEIYVSLECLKIIDLVFQCDFRTEFIYGLRRQIFVRKVNEEMNKFINRSSGTLKQQTSGSYTLLIASLYFGLLTAILKCEKHRDVHRYYQNTHLNFWNV